MIPMTYTPEERADAVSMSRLLAHLVTELEASVTQTTTDERGRYVTALVTSPRSDFAWLIGQPCERTRQSFSLTPMRDRDGEFVPAGGELWCVTREEIAFLMQHPYGRATGLYREVTS